MECMRQTYIFLGCLKTYNRLYSRIIFFIVISNLLVITFLFEKSDEKLAQKDCVFQPKIWGLWVQCSGAEFSIATICFLPTSSFFCVRQTHIISGRLKMYNDLFYWILFSFLCRQYRPFSSCFLFEKRCQIDKKLVSLPDFFHKKREGRTSNMSVL